MAKISDYFLNIHQKWQYLPLALVLIVAGYFYLNNLGVDYITLWDETVHVNVVKNLSEDPWPPKLHLTDIGIDFQDWTNNYVWVHKPLMPLYLQAIFYKAVSAVWSIFGPSTGSGIKNFDIGLFAFRLPGVLFALMSIIALFFFARRHFGYIVAITSASLFAFNPYVFELVKGRQFSGLHDLMFVFFGILALDRILRISVLSKSLKLEAQLLSEPVEDQLRSQAEFLTHSTSSGIKNSQLRKHFLLFGLFTGLAYLSKGGLALLFFPGLLFTSLIAISTHFFDAKRAGEGLLNFLYAGLVMLIIILPEKLGLFLLYPAEYYFEQSAQVLHLFKDLEYWGRPWDYYFTVYLRDMLLPYLYFPAITSIFYGLWQAFQKQHLLGISLHTVKYLSTGRVQKYTAILAIWVLSFLVPLSFGITKISNFIFAALPALLILLVLMIEDFWRRGQQALLFSLSATAVLSYTVIRLDLGRVKYHLFQEQIPFQRFAILFFATLFFVVFWIIYRLLEKGFYRLLPERAERVEGHSVRALGFLTLRPFRLMLKVVSKTEPLAQGSKIFLVFSILLILGTYIRANQLAEIKPRQGFEYQLKIKQAALSVLDGSLPQTRKTPIFLLNYPELPKAHLYFQYWSGLDAMEIYDRQPVYVLKKIMPKDSPLFIVSGESINSQKINLVDNGDYGYVYRLNFDKN